MAIREITVPQKGLYSDFTLKMLQESAYKYRQFWVRNFPKRILRQIRISELCSTLSFTTLILCQLLFSGARATIKLSIKQSFQGVKKIKIFLTILWYDCVVAPNKAVTLFVHPKMLQMKGPRCGDGHAVCEE
uniref:Uncharacterized protein n=1 Tax=Glossina austeni TaxID=7395 RepID=A0A1A9UVJ4_GLOAU